jgi:hypothetical protein
LIRSSVAIRVLSPSAIAVAMSIAETPDSQVGTTARGIA